MDKLKQISLFLSLSLILTIFLISIQIKIKTMKINELEKKHYNQEVKISGKIINIRNYQDFQILTVEDPTDQIQIISNIKNTNLTKLKNQTVEITGRIDFYNNNLQINANKINKK